MAALWHAGAVHGAAAHRGRSAFEQHFPLKGFKQRRYAMTATSSPMVTTNPQQTIAPPPRSAPPQEVASDLLLHRSLVNTYALRTAGGLLLIDSGLTQNSQSV